MKIKKYENREVWLADRFGRITGTKLKDILSKKSTTEKIGFYQLIAERIAVPEEGGETPMDRGVRLEPEAIEKFAELTKKKFNTDLVLWVRDDNENIAYSPDAYVEGKKKKVTEAVEVKCLSSARHLEAYITNSVPDEYVAQTRQAFIANDDLELLYVVFYDPRIKAKPLFCLTLNRLELADEIEYNLAYEREKLASIEKWVAELTY